jgi:hypothetical protein
MVKSLRAMGLSAEQIALQLDIPLAQLLKEFRDEMARAIPELKAKVAGHLFQAAISGDLRAIIFWLKTRAGWRERERHEIVDVAPAPLVLLRPPAILPCNTRCAGCRLIADPLERKRAYERVLGRKLPDRDPSEYRWPNEAEREARRQAVLEHCLRVSRKRKTL